MPPAFVLSQDQTLKFIPGPPHRPTAPAAPDRNPGPPAPSTPGGTHNQGPPNIRSSCANVRQTHAAARASLPIVHNLNQQSPHPTNAATGAALITPPLNPRQPRSGSALSTIGAVFAGAALRIGRARPRGYPRRARRTGKMGAGMPAVQRSCNKNTLAEKPPQSRPSARSSASIRSGGSPPSVRAVGRRVFGRQIAPALKRPPGPRQGRHQSAIDLDQAIAAAILVTLAAKPGDRLAHPDLAADDPIDRAAGEHLGGAARMVSGIDPVAAALGRARRPHPAQLRRYRRCRPRA